MLHSITQNITLIVLFNSFGIQKRKIYKKIAKQYIAHYF